jgi:hypothetical protein
MQTFLIVSIRTTQVSNKEKLSNQISTGLPENFSQIYDKRERKTKIKRRVSNKTNKKKRELYKL